MFKYSVSLAGFSVSAALAFCSPSFAWVSSESELPPGSIPALYYWSKYHTGGFGQFSKIYPYGAHPGYWRRTNYSKDLTSGHGFLVDNPSALLGIFSDSEERAYQIYPDIVQLYRNPVWSVSPYGGFTGSEWAADLYDEVNDRVYRDEHFASWNFSLYSGRACADRYEIQGVFPNGLGQPATEFYCSPMAVFPIPELNLGCPIGDESRPSMGKGNPIHITTGNKFQKEAIYGPVGQSPLEFSWYYNSQKPVSEAFQKWTHTYDRFLTTSLMDVLSYSEEVRDVVPQSKNLGLMARRADGRTLRFSNTFDWDARTTENSQWAGTPNFPEKLFSRNDPATGEIVGFDLISKDGSKESYSLSGELEKITLSDGRWVSPSYDELGHVESVTDNFGNHIDFEYSGNKISSIISVDGSKYGFVYDSVSNLTAIVWPDETPLDTTDNSTKTFVFEDGRFPSYMTGIIDERGNRYATWSYDETGRAVSSDHADGSDTFTLSYDGYGSARVVDPHGNERIYYFKHLNGLSVISSVGGGDCTGCGDDYQAYEYDERGYIQKKVDWKGQSTIYQRDEFGRELSRIEAVGAPEERTVTTTWDANLNKPLVITEPGRIINFTYDTQGRLESRVVQSQP